MSSLLRRLLRDKMAFAGLVILLVFAIIAIFAPLLANHPDEIYDTFLMERLQPPSAEHWFGTDRVGADVYSRLLFGTRITLFTALAGVAASMLIGVPLGLLAGFMDGLAGGVVPRVADIFLSIPQVILAIAIAQTLGPSVFNVILALSVTFWPWFTRLVAAETRALRRELFVEASVALGASPLRVMVFHVLPNLASPLIVRTTLSMGYAILTAAALGFLGLGAQAPSPEWGRTIAESREYLPEAWWYALAPGLAIFLVVMGFNLFGDGLRDVLDPRLRRSAAMKPSSATYDVATDRVAAE
jgi:peptide/nickel transport system permease protein